MIACIFLNGECSPQDPALALTQKVNLVIAADGGYDHARAAQIDVDIVIGDFDSKEELPLPSSITQIHDPSQESSDFEKAISRLPTELQTLHIFGGLGKRHDHFLNNLLIAAALSPTWNIVFHGSSESWHRVTPAKKKTFPAQIGQTISLIPLSRATVNKTSGLQWNLCDKTMGIGEQLGLSNCATSEQVSIETISGHLFVVIHHDQQL